MFKKLEKYIMNMDDPKENILEILIIAQSFYGKFSGDIIEYLSSICKITSEEIKETIEFFPFLLGDRKKLDVCKGLRCSMRGADFIFSVVDKPDIDVLETPCRGLCSSAPNLWIDGEHYGNIDREKLKEIKNILKLTD